SLAAQKRDQAPPFADFERLVAKENEGHCHNMRGEPIDMYSGDLHRLFEELPAAVPGLKTIGVGDGANEIGMGSLAWEDLARRLSGDQAGRVPCRVGCDWTTVAGVSNWGGYALAAGFAWRRGQVDLLCKHTASAQRRVLEELVERGPAVDGVSRLQTATVDGLSFEEYIAPWDDMRSTLGLSLTESGLA
ncbi:MAG: DUF4392 domain-containing protein, partial [Planctomycetota bacterium]|nr:DUF4392 domain-containing protein [Planctomycetota bacterium]